MKASAVLKRYTMLIALVVVIILFSALTGGRLLLAQNVSNLLLQNAYVLIMACGMLLCILTGGNVDLSVGSTLCFAAAVSAKIMSDGGSAGTAILASLIIAAVIGLCQGYLIGYVHIPPFICTLAGMFLFRGAGRVVLNSQTINISNQSFLNIFTSYIKFPGEQNRAVTSSLIICIIVALCITVLQLIQRKTRVSRGYDVEPLPAQLIKLLIIDAVIIWYGSKLMQYKGIPVMIIWIHAVVLIFAFLTSQTTFGRYFYAVGGNEKATKLSGIDPRRVYFWAYFLMSFLAGFAGLAHAARIGSVDGSMGNSFEMDAIASCFIGGASAYGGSGNVSGVVVGAILLGVINQGMSIYDLADEWQYVVKGAVLLAAVIIDVVSKHKTGKS